MLHAFIHMSSHSSLHPTVHVLNIYQLFIYLFIYLFQCRHSTRGTPRRKLRCILHWRHLVDAASGVPQFVRDRRVVISVWCSRMQTEIRVVDVRRVEGRSRGVRPGQTNRPDGVRAQQRLADSAGASQEECRDVHVLPGTVCWLNVYPSISKGIHILQLYFDTPLYSPDVVNARAFLDSPRVTSQAHAR